jgi:hypothetical protein
MIQVIPVFGSSLAVGAIYRTNGRLVRADYPGKLIYQWGNKGVKGVKPMPIYYIPIGNGLTGEYVPTRDIVQANDISKPLVLYTGSVVAESW